jgi:hypothetical protein
MSLTDAQIKELASKMQFKLADCCFKDELEAPLQYNESYIINLEDSVDKEGNPNDGTHWCFVQCNKYPNGNTESIYFDPYGAPPPEHVKDVVKKTTGKNGLPHTTADIQSLMNNACGFYCLALGHWLNASQYRTKDLFEDVGTFMDMFEDLNKSIDFKKNEYILKHFFRSADPALRTAIDVEKISKEDEKGGIDMFKLPVSMKQL